MSSQNPRGSGRKRVVLSPESLEDRTVPAGNVTAFVSGGVLHVWGDGADNRVWISGAGDDTAVVASLDGTTINGARATQWFDGIKFAYDVRLHNGNDFIYTSGLTGTAGLFIDTGRDNDGVSIEHVNLDGVLANTGTGNDTVSVGGGKFNWAAFNLGFGDDRMNVFGTEFDGIAFNGGSGGDALGVMAVKWNDFPLTTAFESVFGSLLPVANNDTARVAHGESVRINVLANDSAVVGILDPNTVQITRQPADGTARVNADGSITYTSDDNSTGTRDSFSYTVRSSTGAVSNVATVTLVLPVVPDETGPVPTITTTAADTTNLAIIPFTVTFNESVTGFALTDIVVTNGTASNFAGSGTTFTFDVDPTADGPVVITIAAGAAEDAAGNPSVAATKTVTSDTTPPTATITGPASPTGTSPIPFTVTFNEPVTSFILGDITVTNGTASNFAGSGTTYTFSVTPTADGDVTVSFPANVANDAGGNGNLAPTPLTVVFDGGDPGVAVTTSAGNPTNLATIPFTATFTEAVTGLLVTEITVTNGTASNLQGTGTTYTFDVTPTADGDVTVTIPAGAAIDSGSNPNTASTPITVVSDQTAPTPTVSSSSPDPTTTNPIPFTVTFSESVTNFTAGDVQVVNGTVANFTGSGTTYNFDVVPSGASVLVEVSVPADVAEDAATNGNLVSNTLTRQFNGSVVSASITTTASDPTNLSPIPFTVTFGESVTGFDLTDINVTNGTPSNLAGSGTTFTFDVTPTADGPVVIDIPAAAATGTSGNPTGAAQFTITSDTTEPDAIVSTTASNPTSTNPIPFTVTFSEDVIGFDAADVTVVNGTVTNFAGSGTTYTFDVVPSGPNVTIDVSVAAAVAQDAATNDNTVSNTVSITFSGSAVSTTITTTANDPTNLSPIPFTVTFGEAVTGFDIGDIVVANGTPSNLAGSGTTFTFDVTPTADGLVTVDIASGAATGDVSGGSTDAAQFTITSDTTEPAVEITTTATDPTNLAVIPFTVTFTEDVTGFDIGDIVVANGTPSNIAGSGTTYTFDVTPTADGAITVDIAAAVAIDAAGNDNTAATQFTLNSDLTNPTVAINDTAVGAITGTSSDTSSVTGVEISINNGTGFWNGTDFTGATEQFFATTSSDNFATWTFAFAPGGPFTVNARATDGATNVGTGTNPNVTVT